MVGFAAETGDDTGSVLDLGRAKLARKGCDLLVVNDVAAEPVFGADDNQAVILGSDGVRVDVATGPKAALAHAVGTRSPVGSPGSQRQPPPPDHAATGRSPWRVPDIVPVLVTAVRRQH